MNQPTRRQKVFAVLVFIGSLALSLAVFLMKIPTEEIAALGYPGIFLITLLGAMTLFVPGPTMVAAFLIGSSLNPLVVSLLAGLGSALGETTGYTAGLASRDLIRSPQAGSAWYWRILNWMARYPFFTLFLVSAIPNPVTDVAGLIAGRARYPYLLYLLATFLGKTIRFGIGAYLGAYFGRNLFGR